MSSQVAKYWIRIYTVDLTFLEDREVGIEIFLNKTFNFCLRSTFLVEELVAWKRQNLKSFAAQLVVHFDHFLIVRRGKTSLTCHINNHDAFSVLKLIKVNNFPIDIPSLKIIECFGNFSGNRSGSSFEYSLADKGAHKYIYILIPKI